MPIDITPGEGYVAIQLFNVDDEESSSGMGAPGMVDEDDYRETIYAQVIAAGAKTPSIAKKGATVLVRKSSAKGAVKISDDVLLVDGWAIVASAGK